jgi:hypothetical protein
MGREARVKKERRLKGTDVVVYTDAPAVQQEADLVRRATEAGLVLPRIVLSDDH